MSRKFDWNTLVAIRKPSTYVIGIVVVVGTVRGLADKYGFSFDVPFRSRLAVVGALVVLVAWALIQFLRPKVIVLTQDKKTLASKGGLPHLLHELEAAIEASAKDFNATHVNNTLTDLLPAQAVRREPAPTRAQLFLALRGLQQGDATLNQAIVSANALFAHQKKTLQVLLGILLIEGYLLIVASIAIPLYYFLK